MLISVKKKIIVLFTFLVCLVLVPLLSVKGNKSSHGLDFNFKDMSTSKNENVMKDNKYFYVFDESSNKTLKIPDRDFLYGAVVAEMPARFEVEALKAQAVASYTYFCRMRNNHKNSKDKDYQFVINTEKCINYASEEQMRKKWGNDFEIYYCKIKEAVDSVFGEVIEEDGNLILAAYHAISSGRTEKSADVFGGDLKYLINVESPGDKLAAGYESTLEVSREKFKEILSNEWNDCKFESNPKDWIGESFHTDGGMIKEINLCSHMAKGTDVRRIFGLRSSDFEINYDSQDDKFIFKVLGYGHGVGMSQCGAQYMAQQGADYKKILEWYYPNTIIAKL